MTHFDIVGDKGFNIRIHWSESYDITSNTSVVSITNVQFARTWSSGYPYYFSGTIKINNVTVVEMNSETGRYKIPFSGELNSWVDIVITQSGKALPWTSDNIIHNDDGSGTTKIEVTLYAYNNEAPASYQGLITSITQTIALTTIPRASSFTLDKTSLNVKETITATITSASNNFTHTVEFYINSNYYKSFSLNAGVKTQSYQIPEDWYNYMSTTTSCTAYCRVTTYNNGTQIGEQTRKSFTANVPSNIVPTVGAISLDPTDINGRNILVKGKNSLTISVSGSKAGTGSSIKSYTFSGPSVSTTTTNNYVTAPSVSNTGTLTYTVTVTDKRDRTNSATATIFCHDYYSPYFTSFNAYRSNSNGDPDLNGTWLRCTYGTMHASVDGTNSVSVTAYYNNKSAAASNGDLRINLNGDNTTTYKISLKVVDAYGGSNTSSTITVFAQARIFNITKDGTGVAIGKMAESTNLFECRWNAVFDGTASGPSGFSTSSDARVKRNVKDINVDIIDNLRPIQYELINSHDGKTHYGFIAQEVEELLTDVGLNSESMGIIGQVTNGGQNQYVLTYTEFVPLLTKKCQLLQAETNMLRQEINELKEMIKGRD